MKWLKYLGAWTMSFSIGAALSLLVLSSAETSWQLLGQVFLVTYLITLPAAIIYTMIFDSVKETNQITKRK